MLVGFWVISLPFSSSAAEPHNTANAVKLKGISLRSQTFFPRTKPPSDIMLIKFREIQTDKYGKS